MGRETTKKFTIGFIKDIRDIKQICDKIGNDYVEIDMPIGDNGENVVVSICFEKNRHLSDD